MKNKKTGLGEFHLHVMDLAKQKILNELDSEKWIRFNELREKTGLSTSTLTRHLKELQKGIVEKYIDKKSGEYPLPVYYKLNYWANFEKEMYKIIFDKQLDRKELGEKDQLASYIEYLNVQVGFQLLNTLRNYFDKDFNEVAFNQVLENYVVSIYRKQGYILKEALKEISDKGVNVPYLITEAEGIISTHFAETMKSYRKGKGILSLFKG